MGEKEEQQGKGRMEGYMEKQKEFVNRDPDRVEMQERNGGNEMR